MTNIASPLTRRMLVGALVGGGAVAAVATSGPPKVRQALTTFRQSFRSPFQSLEHGDHNLWQMAVGSLLQISGGPSMQVLGVELFALYGKGASRTSRRRAFAVNLQVQGGVGIVGDTVYSVSHPRHGKLQLFLSTHPVRPDLVVAVFN